jgi:hypothetical protein
LYALMELILAVVASRSSLVSALLRAAVPANRHAVFEVLSGLSRDELECLAEFQGACALEERDHLPCNPYRLLPEFFDPFTSERWRNGDDRAHKTFIVLAWLEHTKKPAAAVRVRTASIHAA